MSASYRPDRYRLFRPSYPPELFAWLARCAPSTALAWDAGTGSGQAAAGLGECFERVLATDRDARQLEHAQPHSRVEYRAGVALPDVPAESVDLATAACAAHWFELDAYYREVRRVLRPGGVIALWTYTWPELGAARVDGVLARLRDEVLGPFWPAGFELALGRYRELPFPFEDELEAPDFRIRCAWGSDELLDFLSTWSGALRYAEAQGEDPTAAFRAPLARAWSADGLGRGVELPLYFRVARV